MSYFFQSINMRRGKEAYIAEWFQAIIHVSITLKYLKKNANNIKWDWETSKRFSERKRKREGLCSNIKRISLNEESNGEN